MRTSVLLSLVCLAVGSVIGCSQTPAFNEMIKQSFTIKPNANGIGDGTSAEEEKWIRQTGIEARGDRPMESENDPFRVLMSPKAQSIERNLGIE